MSHAQKAYEAFKSITATPIDRSETAKLNVLYSISCRAEKDEAYRKELEAFAVPDMDMNILEAIDTFFREFNTAHGVDIRLNLKPFDNPDYPEGLYFDVRTYKKSDNKLTECSPIEFKAGEEATFRGVICNRLTDAETVVPLIKYYCYSEDGSEISGEVRDTSTVEFAITCKRAGAVRAELIACDKDGKRISGSENGVPGALFDFTDIRTTNPTPEDMEDFWRSEVARLNKTLPTDTELTAYSGNVVYAMDVDKTNYYHIKKADSSYMAMLRSKHITSDPDTVLDGFDLWEFSLKCPGPCPSTGYISIPKNAEPSSLYLRFIYAGYGAHSPRPFFDKKAIFVYSTHHGYPCGLSDEECYNELNGNGILGNYGRGNGAANSMFDNAHDCYSLYLNLRNLQALRFVANPEFSRDIPEIARCWNGDARFEGSSLGGYQSIAMCALAKFLDEKVNIVKGVSTVPGFCNYAGKNDKRLPVGLLQWAKNAEYFDGAHLASLIENPMVIDRNSFGDELCSSSSICMAYNNFKSNKEIRFLQNSSHGYRPKAEAQLWYIHKA